MNQIFPPLLPEDNCDCSCHRITDKIDSRPCCYLCHICGKTISRFTIIKHEEKCKETLLKNTDKINNLLFCNCPCHQGEEIEHKNPCCYPCPICGENIKRIDRGIPLHIEVNHK